MGWNAATIDWEVIIVQGPGVDEEGGREEEGAFGAMVERGCASGGVVVSRSTFRL